MRYALKVKIILNMELYLNNEKTTATKHLNIRKLSNYATRKWYLPWAEHNFARKVMLTTNLPYILRSWKPLYANMDHHECSEIHQLVAAWQWLVEETFVEFDWGKIGGGFLKVSLWTKSIIKTGGLLGALIAILIKRVIGFQFCSNIIIISRKQHYVHVAYIGRSKIIHL